MGTRLPELDSNVLHQLRADFICLRTPMVRLIVFLSMPKLISIDRLSSSVCFYWFFILLVRCSQCELRPQLRELTLSERSHTGVE
jgi:hypothetical protein